MSGEVVPMTLLGGMGTIFACRRRVRDHRPRELPRAVRRRVTVITGVISSCACSHSGGIVGELVRWANRKANVGRLAGLALLALRRRKI
jgi:hypothetical protein